MNEIPVVDIGRYLATGDAATAAAAIEDAVTQIGFFQIVGHGVPTARLDAVYAAAADLAALPEPVKEALLSPTGHPYRGVHLKRDAAGRVRQERFMAARFDDPGEAVAHGVPVELADFYDPNVWPAEVPALRQAIRELFEHSRLLGGEVMRLFALALGLDDGGFDPYLEPNASLFAINHYPPAGLAGVDDQPLLFAEHSDGNTLTILHQRGDFEGLQVQRLDAPGEWIPVPVRDDALVINVGELMTRWTNDHWPATRHRVVASSNPTATRTTLATFHMPVLQTVVAPLARWVNESGPHYEPVTAYEWEFRGIRSRYSGVTDATGLRQSDRSAEFARRLGS